MIKNRKIKMLLAGIALVAFVAAGGYTYMYYQLSKVKHVAIPTTDEELGIKNEEENSSSTGSQNQESAAAAEQQPAVQSDPETVNIALFGVDRREPDEAGRSDTIIIMSIDYVHNKIKLTSIMRDTYVHVEGHGNTKINHAYAYGGPALAIKTLNSNFNLNIRDFVTVDFQGFEKIVDLLGGVEIEIKSYELPTMETVGIYEAGIYNLNGEQALAYSRIRHQGNGDYERTERQRRVLSAIFEKVKADGTVKLPTLVSTIAPFAESSLTTDEILSLGTSVFAHNISAIEQARFPLDSISSEETIDGLWYIVTDLDVTADKMNKFIYEDINPGN